MSTPDVIVGTNSWVTLAEADGYFASKWGAEDWGRGTGSVLSEDQKAKLLVSAFNWIRQQPDLSVDPSATGVPVKYAQLEAAWFIYKWSEEYEKRRAMSSMGVKSWRALDVSETLEGVKFPEHIAAMLSAYATGGGGRFPRVSRNMKSNTSE